MLLLIVATVAALWLSSATEHNDNMITLNDDEYGDDDDDSHSSGHTSLSRQHIANITPTNHVSEPLFLLSFYSLVAVIKVHANPKTNVKAKTNPNPDLQKTWGKNFKNVKNNVTHNIGTRDSISTIRTPYHYATKSWADLGEGALGPCPPRWQVIFYVQQ